MSVLIAVILLLSLVPAMAFAVDGPVTKGALQFIYNESAGSGGKFTTVDYNKANDQIFPSTWVTLQENCIVGDSYEIGSSVTVKKPEKSVVNDTETQKSYECIGFVTLGSDQENLILKDSATSRIVKFETNSEKTIEVHNTDITTDDYGQYLYICFLWKEIEQWTVTYDFSGPENTTVYPVVSPYRAGENAAGQTEPPYSLGYFTVSRDVSNPEMRTDMEDANQKAADLNLIYSDSTEPKEYNYASPTSSGQYVINPDALKLRVEFEKENPSQLKAKTAKGSAIALSKMAQQRNYAIDQNRHLFYPVVGYVAVGSNGEYYQLTGWETAGKDVEVTGLYGSFNPTGDTTLKAVWERITLSDTAAGTPDVPLLKTYTVNDVTYSVQLRQKTTGEFNTSDAVVASDGSLTYEVDMQFSDFFTSTRELPWNDKGDYFKTVDNPEFADVNIEVELALRWTAVNLRAARWSRARINTPSRPNSTALRSSPSTLTGISTAVLK